jgi:ABC-type sugar transport system substrate-binding protein
MASIGQNFVSAGQAIAPYMAQHGYIKQGAQVVCPVEDPAGAYATERAKGVNSVLASFGAHCDVVGVGFSITNESTMLDYHATPTPAFSLRWAGPH